MYDLSETITDNTKWKLNFQSRWMQIPLEALKNQPEK